jgi:CNT family concentrative nucleoside transporter
MFFAVFRPYETTLTDRLISFAGIWVMVALAWLMSVDRKAIRWRPVAWGIALQLAFGLVVLSPQLANFFFVVVDVGVKKLLSFSEAGATFVFQSIEPHQILDAQGNAHTYVGGVISPPVKTFAFWILPSIIFFSSLMAVGYHLGIMQRVVWALAWVMQRTMGTSGAESLSTAANIFVGQTEAPLLVRPYIPKMTMSELHCIMVGGFATVAGGVMAAYVGFLRDVPGIAGHLVTASILGGPATIAISKIVVQETGKPETSGMLELDLQRQDRNLVAAVARGATEGGVLVINVIAMLIAFVAMIAMVDAVLGMAHLSGEPLSLARILGWLMAPAAFVMGVPWADCEKVGSLLGEKVVLTEFIAYVHLGGIVEGNGLISERAAVIASYALCGFANFASVGIQLGGIGGMAPDRMGDLSALGLRAMVAGSLATFMAACVAGMLL